MRKRKQGGGRRRKALGHTVPYRSCVACRRSAPRSESIRFTRSPDGSLNVDVAARAAGRGAWTCPSAACVTRACERGGFARAFSAPVLGGPEELLEQVRCALAHPGAPAVLVALFSANLSQDFSPVRLAHPRGRA